jgi:cytochrome c556
MPEWFISTLMMDRALDAVVRRVKSLDRKHDIPYLAGYSNDGKTIYIDRHMPPSFKYQGREINTDRYLILHEEVEKTLIDQLNLHYLHAHQIASRAEQAAVRAAGVNWRDYDRFMQENVKLIGDERLTKVPADLDLKPYRDEHDYDLVQRMLASIARGEAPFGIKAEHVHAAVARHMPHLKQPKSGAKSGGAKSKAKSAGRGKKKKR